MTIPVVETQQQVVKIDPVGERILQELSNTPFNCVHLVRLTGGILNFVYRGTLSHPLSDGAITVIIKHAEEFMPGLEGYTLSTHRSFFEACILRSVHAQVESPNTAGLEIVVPRVYHFNTGFNTQVLEDFTGQISIRDFLKTRCTQDASRVFASRLGFSVGSWLSSLHHWGEGKTPQEVSHEEQANRDVHDATFDFYYDNAVRKAEQLPHILQGCKQIFEQVKEGAARELRSMSGEKLGMIHGDMSTNNILIADNQSIHVDHSRLVVIDWELSQYNSQLRDCGQFISDIYKLQHFGFVDPNTGMAVIRGFIEGYSPLHEDAIFKFSIHIGLFLLLWDVALPGPHDADKVADLVALARDLVVSGWERDLHALLKTFLGKCLNGMAG
ncbi:hypothetical protein N7520_000538 [Penicillium odoratum]|uniref:uncharacterized protein n=1 Tax=Penicillium odoratum TaxID=1167516 RepID=UPI00254963B2|nr:uncharacterized protein N7520_000538 [Penicillium odoratum]KAJ5777292.1 hypothetical protein N7520_000538 [Penicillium odoratum]